MTDTLTKYLPANTGAATDELADIEIELIDADPANERAGNLLALALAGTDTGMEALKASILAHGLNERLHVYRKPDERYLLNRGHRRLAAIIALFRQGKLAWTRVPAVVADMPADARRRHLDRIISNELRQDADPIMRARSMDELIQGLDGDSLTQAEVGAAIGKSQSWVANEVRLLKLGPQAQELISGGELTSSHGVMLLRLKEPEIDVDGAEQRSVAALHDEYALIAKRDRLSKEALGECIDAFLNGQWLLRQNLKERDRRAEEQEREREAERIAASKRPIHPVPKALAPLGDEPTQQAPSALAAPSEMLIAETALDEDQVRGWMAKHSSEYENSEDLASHAIWDALGESAEVSDEQFAEVWSWAQAAMDIRLSEVAAAIPAVTAAAPTASTAPIPAAPTATPAIPVAAAPKPAAPTAVKPTPAPTPTPTPAKASASAPAAAKLRSFEKGIVKITMTLLPEDKDGGRLVSAMAGIEGGSPVFFSGHITAEMAAVFFSGRIMAETTALGILSNLVEQIQARLAPANATGDDK